MIEPLLEAATVVLQLAPGLEAAFPPLPGSAGQPGQVLDQGLEAVVGLQLQVFQRLVLQQLHPAVEHHHVGFTLPALVQGQAQTLQLSQGEPGAADTETGRGLRRISFRQLKVQANRRQVLHSEVFHLPRCINLGDKDVEGLGQGDAGQEVTRGWLALVHREDRRVEDALQDEQLILLLLRIRHGRTGNWRTQLFLRQHGTTGSANAPREFLPTYPA
uniref:Uncharacterized protein n=1 Tax=Ixodes ricinus TaxID=34613 RepID=A0A6B0V3P5_IXORI